MYNLLYIIKWFNDKLIMWYNHINYSDNILILKLWFNYLKKNCDLMIKWICYMYKYYYNYNYKNILYKKAVSG